MRRQPVTQLFAIAAVVLVASSCSPRNGGGAALIANGNGTTSGIVSYVDLEGGFYGIITDKGLRHNPAKLHIDFRVDGLRVSYKYKTLQNVASIQMWGTSVEILEVQVQSKR